MSPYHRLFYRALLYLAQMEGPLSRGLHKLVRAFYLTVFIRGFRALFCLRHGTNHHVQWVIRHSTKSGDYFNSFFSDLDLTAILHNPSEKGFRAIRTFGQSCRRFCPFLGEIEIMTIDEKTRFDLLLKKHGELYRTLRTVRKIRWIEKSLESPRSAYHRAKALRAIEICLRSLNARGRAEDQRNFRWVSPPLEAYLKKRYAGITVPHFDIDRGCSYMSSYMEAVVGVEQIPPTQTRQEHPTLHLSPDVSMLLFALAPGFVGLPEDQIQLTEQLRRENSQLQSDRSALAEIEVLVFQAFIRAQSEVEPWMSRWLNQLHGSLPQQSQAFGS
jgi:hypothetical protein